MWILKLLERRIYTGKRKKKGYDALKFGRMDLDRPPLRSSPNYHDISWPGFSKMF